MRCKIEFKLKLYKVLTDTDIITKQEQISEAVLEALHETYETLQNLYVEMAESDNQAEYTEDVSAKLRSYWRTSDNLVRAYQQNAANIDELFAHYKALPNEKQKKLIPKAPANPVIDLEESRSNHFARGMNIYKILIISYIGSFLGVITEMLWCLLIGGYVESRAGLVYGPFNLLYGAGAVAMTLALYSFRN